MFCLKLMGYHGFLPAQAVKGWIRIWLLLAARKRKFKRLWVQGSAGPTTVEKTLGVEIMEIYGYTVILMELSLIDKVW